MKNSLLVLFVLALMAICSCSSQKDAYLKQLKYNSLGNYNMEIGIPENYKIEKFEGPDFDNFYFYNVDSTDTVSFTGGVYIGFNPSRFSPKPNCSIREVRSELLDKKTEWTVFEYTDSYFVQAIVDYKADDGYEMKIHCFGQCKKSDEIEKLIWIFGSLRNKK